MRISVKLVEVDMNPPTSFSHPGEMILKKHLNSQFAVISHRTRWHSIIGILHKLIPWFDNASMCYFINVYLMELIRSKTNGKQP